MKGTQTFFPASVDLSTLTPATGFTLDGVVSSQSVSGAGDINGDGVADLIVGVWGANSGAGASYVVFGKSDLGSTSSIALSSLNGSNGFALPGIAGSYSGYSVSGAGDVNKDGVADLIIGAYQANSVAGASYVVFGKPGISNTGSLALSSLNGSNGFVVPGVVSSESGNSVSGAGDINGDGVADLIIGAPYANSYAGASYVVFGKPGLLGSGSLALSSLDGSNGFVLSGVTASSKSGYSVSGAGDINGDGVADLIIGAPYANGNIGASYVVFGKPGIGNIGSLALSSLNGSNGFVLPGPGVATDNESGHSVSGAGDINGDGVADLIIGAYRTNSGAGASYVVFGKPGLGSTGSILLSSLDGSNGFVLPGVASSSTGNSVSGAGDINGDGVADLIIGAYRTNSGAGASYVVFGKTGLGGSGSLPLSSLDGSNGFVLPGVTNSGNGYSVSGAGDINGDGVADLIIGTYQALKVYVVFGDIPPVLVNNSLSLSVGAAVRLNPTYLAAYDRNHNNNTLVFVPSAVSHGQFETVGVPGIPLVNFTQQQIVNSAIQFVHDGTLVAPTYNITVRSDGIAWTGPRSAEIAFSGTPSSYFPAVISLSSLNGQNGFKLDGENTNDNSGLSVSTAGDINGDGYADLIIGAYGYPKGSDKGRSYVVFGGAGLGGAGVFNLSSLNGLNGFKLNGENNNDQSGYSVGMIGDINADGQDDLIIGAYGYPGGLNKGRSYVVFGGTGVGGGGILNLTSLNGINGFKLNGENNNDYSGWSVSTAGDMNADGQADLIIGAFGYPSGSCKGRSYVVFGGTGVGGGGILNLTSLNSINGFKLNGENINDYSGWSVSAAGDINGDGQDDLIIGAYNYLGGSGKGRSYVVFGGANMGGTGILNLTSLNGVNGFKLNGENNNDGSGNSVSAARDINGDGYDDLIIGAYNYPGGNGKGRSYVVFGGADVGGTGILNLSNLSGANGFKLDGENSNDNSGWFVSATGDINGDGYNDLLIGAPYYLGNNARGRSYLILGGPEVGSGGILNLSSLTGGNGFKLDGENSNDLSGYSVSVIGDINGDGPDDLIIGANRYPGGSNKGRSYVVFGDIPPVLVQNRLNLQGGSQAPLNSTFLSAYDRNHNNNTLVFVPTAVSHGQFELVAQPGVSLINFTQPQLMGGSVRFVHDGSSFAPSYNMTVYSAGIAWTGPTPANITFIPVATTTQTPTTVPTPTPSPTRTSTPSPTGPVLLTNQLTLSNGQAVILSASNLKASEAGFNNSQLIFSVANVQNGYFSTALTSNGALKNLTSFTQGQIQSGMIEFVHSNNGQAPAYSVLVTDGVQSTLPSAALIHFEGAPIITQNTLNITVGGVITLTPAMLDVTATDGSVPSQVIITVSDLQHATITSTATGTSVNNFTLADVQAGDIQLTDDGSLITPSYIITVEGVKSLSSAPNQTQVYLSNQGVYAPQLVNNYLAVTQGAATLLSNRYLSAMQSDGQALDNTTLFYLSNINYGHFSLTAQPQTWLSFFSQAQLSSGQVQFVQDGSLSIPSYSSAVKAFGLQSASQPAGIFFTPLDELSPSPAFSGGTEYSTVQKAIIGAVVSGTIGIFFAVLQSCLKRAANKKLLQALGEGTDEYDLTVVRPVAKEIAQRIKITGFLNATTNREMMSFKGAVRSLLAALDERGVDLNFAEMKPAKKDALINEIGNQVERWVKVNRGGCTACCPGLTAFFKPQLNPDSLKEAVGEIADKVVQARKSHQSLSAGLSVSGSPVFKVPERKPSVELSLVDSPSVQPNPPEELRSGLSVSQLS